MIEFFTDLFAIDPSVKTVVFTVITGEEAGADHVICDDFTHALEKIPGGSDTYFVVVTRGHRHDLDYLSLILKKDYAYIDMTAEEAAEEGDGLRRYL